MLQYVVIVGNSQDTADLHAIGLLRDRLKDSPAPWRSVLEIPGCHAAYVHEPGSVASAIVLDRDGGAILGELFTRGSSQQSSAPVRSLSSVDSDEITRSAGHSLITRFWGHYVAVLRCPEKPGILIVRAPVSSLACFHLKWRTLDIFFSHLEDSRAIAPCPLSINWDCIGAQVAGGDYLTHETALNEIDSVECGECVERLPLRMVKHTYWQPSLFFDDRYGDNFAEVARTLRSTVDDCVAALSANHRSILVSVSGGLDSSIVLSALARAPHRPALTAVNYYCRGNGDERRYARIMSEWVQCRLIAWRRNDRLDMRRFLNCNATLRPVLNFSAPDVEARNADLAVNSGASAIFDGELGDNIFGRNLGFGAIVDALRRKGFGPSFLSVALDYSILTKQSIWRTLASTRRERRDVYRCPVFNSLRTLQSRYGADAAQSLLLASSETSQRYLDTADRFLHPWLKNSRVAAPDSQKILFGLIAVTSTASHSPFSRPGDTPQISPLACQPIAEMALRIPGYLHCQDAQDRAVARAGYADALPPDILRRGTGKGGPDLWAKDVMENNTDFLKGFLLDGILVRQRLIDRQKLEAILSPRMIKSSTLVSDVFAKLYIEAWLNRIQQWALA